MRRERLAAKFEREGKGEDASKRKLVGRGGAGDAQVRWARCSGVWWDAGQDMAGQEALLHSHPSPASHAVNDAILAVLGLMEDYASTRTRLKETQRQLDAALRQGKGDAGSDAEA